MGHKCKICGKITSAGYGITSRLVPELKKEVWLCSEKCAHRFARDIKKERSKQQRKALESAGEKATEDDYINIWRTLTSKEMEKLAMVGFGILRSYSDKTPAGFYKELKTYGE